MTLCDCPTCLTFPVDSPAVLQSVSLCVPSAAPWPPRPSSELWSAGHWSLRRSRQTLKTASRPEILSARKHQDTNTGAQTVSWLVLPKTCLELVKVIDLCDICKQYRCPSDKRIIVNTHICSLNTLQLIKINEETNAFLSHS